VIKTGGDRTRAADRWGPGVSGSGATRGLARRAQWLVAWVGTKVRGGAHAGVGAS
jgi:hypothetical protein